MAAGKYSFTIEQGATLKFGIQYLDSNSVPIDLTDYNGRMQIRSNYADLTNTLYLTVSSSVDASGSGLFFNGINEDQPLTSGSIGVVISAAHTEQLTFSEAYYDLEIYSGSVVNRVIEGIVYLSKEVTRV